MTARTPPPKKTALGVEEMRQRTHGLSQRHRTMLLLVNGKRERQEVLTLAGQAGVDASVLDELVALGLVDAGAAPVVVEVIVEPPLPVLAPSAPPARAPDVAETPLVIAVAPPMDIAPAVPTARVKFSAPHKLPSPPPAPRVKAAVRVPPVDDVPVLTPVKPPARRSAVPMSAPAAPADEEAEQKLIAKVRNLLIGSVLVDSPVTNPMTALRVRKARTREELTALVWEIERRQVTGRRPRETASRLVRARELLGLGNTIVEEDEKSEGDTQPEPPPSA